MPITEYKNPKLVRERTIKILRTIAKRHGIKVTVRHPGTNDQRVTFRQYGVTQGVWLPSNGRVKCIDIRDAFMVLRSMIEG